VGALLLSPFNVKWRCFAWAEGLEESKFCLFSVVFPVRCISSISPRFYFRRHALCFLPLAAILESLLFYLILLWCWRLNPRLWACWASILPLRLHAQPYFFVERTMNCLKSGDVRGKIGCLQIDFTDNYFTLHLTHTDLSQIAFPS
jgi:hypothetical protein